MELKNKKFLIVILRFHGDVLLIEPMITDIRLNYPDSLIDLLVFRGTASLLLHDERINKVIEVDPSSELSFIEKVKSEIILLRKLNSSAYDFGIFLTTQWRLILMGKALRKAKTAAVSDKKREGRLWKGSFSVLFPEAGDNHILERNLNALKFLDMQISQNPTLQLYIPEEVSKETDKFLSTYRVLDKFCVVHPISRRETKLWTLEAFSKLIELLDSRGLQVVLTSGPDPEEIAYVKRLEEMSSSNLKNICGKTSLIGLASIISKAEVFIGLDSVASHIAASVDTPSVTLFGPSNPVNWRPWSKRSHIISRDGTERFCKQHGHKEGKFKRCLCYIDPQRVIKVVDEILI